MKKGRPPGRPRRRRATLRAADTGSVPYARGVVKEVPRVRRPPVVQDLVVQVGPDGQPGAPDFGDLLPALDHLALPDHDPGSVRVTRHVAVAMVDLDHQAVVAVPAREGDPPFRGRMDRRPMRRGD